MSRFPRPGRTPRPRPVPTAGPTPSPTPGPGTTFTLTTRADTATANVFEGPLEIVGNFALNTLTNGDRLTGSGLNPTLNASINELGGTITPALLSGIETLNVSFSALGAAAPTTLAFQNATGLKNVTWENATEANNLTSLTGALQNLTIGNINVGVDAQTFTFANAALAGLGDALTITATGISDTGAGNLNLNTATAGAATSNYETINIVSQGVLTNTFNVAQNSGGYRTLNVSGSAGFTTVNQSANLTTFNASTASGPISYTAGAEGNASYTGGTASDIFILNGTYTANDTVNGGTGVADVLVIDSPNAVVNQVNVSAIDALVIANDPNAAIEITPGFYGGATILAQGADITDEDVTVNAAAGTGTYDFATFENTNGSLTVNIAGTGTNDVYNILSANAAAVDLVDVVAINSAETVNVTNTGAGAVTYEGTFTINPNIGGAGALNFFGSNGFIVEGDVTASSINAAALTGGGLDQRTAAGVSTVNQVAVNSTGSSQADWLTGSAGNDIINSGGGADTINGNGGADALTGGTGFDAFNFSAEASDGAAGALATAASYTTITDFLVGTAAGATDLVRLDTTIGALALDEFGGGAVADGDAVIGVNYVGNTAININASTANLLKITGGVSTTGLNAEGGYQAAIGVGAITVNAAALNVVAVYYDTTNSQAVLGLIVNADTTINAADNFDVISRIKMSAADYANFGATNFAAFESTTI